MNTKQIEKELYRKEKEVEFWELFNFVPSKPTLKRFIEIHRDPQKL